MKIINYFLIYNVKLEEIFSYKKDNDFSSYGFKIGQYKYLSIIKNYICCIYYF